MVKVIVSLTFVSCPSFVTTGTYPGDVHLRHRGDNGHPSSAFPLGLCEGDCDDDHDCLPGLHCFHRHAFEHVPGCQGRGGRGKDYCAYTPFKHLDYRADNRLGMRRNVAVRYIQSTRHSVTNLLCLFLFASLNSLSPWTL